MATRRKGHRFDQRHTLGALDAHLWVARRPRRHTISFFVPSEVEGAFFLPWKTRRALPPPSPPPRRVCRVVPGHRPSRTRKHRSGSKTFFELIHRVLNPPLSFLRAPPPTQNCATLFGSPCAKSIRINDSCPASGKVRHTPRFSPYEMPALG